MELALADHHRMVQKMVRDFGASEVAPRIRELDRSQTFDRTILQKMGALGLLGLCVPERYGGAGSDYISLGLACEELEYVDTSLRVILSVHLGLNSLSLLAWGTEDQRQRFLVRQQRGRKVAAYGLTEPAAGSAAAGSQAPARPGRRTYRLHGHK